MTLLYPLLLRPKLYPKVWGGDRLRRFGKAVSAGERIGESWELADLDATSSSGAGGGVAHSIIENGALRGKTLREASRLFGAGFLGRVGTAVGVEMPFPMLVKFLDARENLSVQVHPSIAYAKANPGACIKTECWYILDAEPGSVIYKGLRAGVTREAFVSHVRAGIGSGIVGDLEAVAAVPGDMHNLPSGTIHALGAGVLVAEVQTPSDTTFRVYDWERVGRELHPEPAIECTIIGPARDATRLPPGAMVGRLVSTGFFVVDELRVRREELAGGDQTALVPLVMSNGGSTTEVAVDRPVVVVMLEGELEVRSMAKKFEPVRLFRGNTAVVPASIVGDCLLCVKRGAKVLRVGVIGA